MKTLKYFLFMLGLVVGGFLLWMNVTPGHFRSICSVCNVMYITDHDVDRRDCGLIEGIRFCPAERMLELLSQLDFFK